ncbi:MAG: hypothetical protein RSF78_10155 [Bacteroidales bacterium]
MKNQVLSVEQMQRLEELGVNTSKASMAFIKLPSVGKFEEDPVSNSQRIFEYIVAMKYIPTFTLQDILNILPKKIDIYHNDSYYYFDLLWNGMFGGWSARYEYYDSIDGRVSFPDESPIQACYEALVWVAENGYLKGNKE